MGQPWGISGPQFLGLYLAGMAATLAVARVLPAAILWIPRRRISRELTTAEVGYLAGGPKRAAEVILADLVERGSWRVDSSGDLTMPDGAVGGGPYAAAAETIGPGEEGTKAHAVCSRLKACPTIARIRGDLRADGLVPSAGQLAGIWAGAAAVLAALVTVGIMRVAEGSANHRPVGFLVLLIIVTFVLVSPGMIALLITNARVTRLGSRYVKWLRRVHETGQAGEPVPLDLAIANAQVSAPGALPATGAGVAAAALAGGPALLGVALAGVAAMPDEQTRAALVAGMTAPVSSSSSCGGAGCGGGGGGCGGGCGG
jgi:uncharacterized protein (TIGR04222 family)